ncbi:MAG: dihydrofolate reductase family protein [Acholeplasmataceae bacterium]
MSQKVKLYIAMTLDGYIADTNGEIDFLSSYGKDGEDYGYHLFMETIDTVIIGKKTYDQVLKFDHGYPYQDQMTYVLTHKKLSSKDKVVFTDDINSMMTQIKASSKKDIFLIGGAQVIKLMLDNDLIDEFHISIIPTLLGDGIRLFLEHETSQDLKLIKTDTYKDGIVKLIYVKK